MWQQKLNKPDDRKNLNFKKEEWGAKVKSMQTS